MLKSSVSRGLFPVIGGLFLAIFLGFLAPVWSGSRSMFSFDPAGRAPQASDVQSSPMDLSGIEMFLELTALLEKDIEPEQAQWDRLFATPGYAVLIKIEFGRDFFAKRFRLAFMPSKKAELEEQMRKETGFWAQFLPHYVRAKAMRREIEAFVAELKASNVYRRAIEQAAAYLPKGAASGTPRVAFLIFAPDGRGYDPIVIDVLESLDSKDGFERFLAHEFHHWFRNRLVDLMQDQSLLWIIGQVQLEGIADLIDKADRPGKPAADLSADEKKYMDFYVKSPDVIREMDDTFPRLSGMRMGRGELGDQLQRDVPMNGHPTGFYMANLIVEELGKDALVSVVGNPFAFFRLYDEAAGKKGGGMPRFSKKALAFIGDLEKRSMN